MASCLMWGKKQVQKCTEYRDEGHNECSEYRDEGYNACSKWDSQCCDWWPCSWACEAVTWFCVAWYWVSNLVCVAWYWVADIVCVAWAWVTIAVCVALDTIVTAVGAIVETVESILGWFLSTLAWFVDLILSIPIIGRLIKDLWNIILTVVWGVVGLIDAVLYLIGIRPEKKLRVCTILLCDDKSEPVDQKQAIVTLLQNAIQIFSDEANVRIINSAPFQYTSGYGGGQTADESWVHDYCSQGGNDSDILDVKCGPAGFADDFWTTGSQLQFIADTQCYYGNFRRFIGYGAPVVIFIVRSIKEGDSSSGGCGDPLRDYITISADRQARKARNIAHELGHACNLWHVSLPTNLMDPERDQTELKWWQAVILRNSRHVTYL